MFTFKGAAREYVLGYVQYGCQPVSVMNYEYECVQRCGLLHTDTWVGPVSLLKDLGRVFSTDAVISNSSREALRSAGCSVENTQNKDRNISKLSANARRDMRKCLVVA